MNNGILLELIAELFQSLVSNDEVTVSRRHIFRLGPNDNAEIDILLSGKFGTSDMKIALECRDRAQPQGKEWIQQIIGKRDDLRSFGIRHWMALSASGFTQPAKDLAERAGIEILVPYDIEPVSSNDIGPHNLLKFKTNYSKWTLGVINAKISYEEISTPNNVASRISNGGFNLSLIIDGDKKTPLYEILNKLASEALKEMDDTNENWSSATRILKLSKLSAEFDGIPFTLNDLEVEAILTKEELKSDFRLITLSNHQINSLIGMIGINSYKVGDDTIYLLVGFKPGYPAKLVSHARTKSGSPIPGVIFELDKAQVEKAGFQFKPPK